MYMIRADTARRLIITEFGGFLSLDEMNSYAAEHKQLAARMFGSLSYAMLFDISNCAIQAQDVVAAFQQWGTGTKTTGRIAVVTGSSIARMQARRATDPARTSIFQTRLEAEDWLFRARSDGC